MKMDKFLNSRAGQVVTIAVVGVIGLYYVKKGAQKAAQAINPVSQDNLAYTGVNSIGEALTGNKRFDLGVWIYDKINGKP